MKNKLVSLIYLIIFISGFTVLVENDIYYEVSKNLEIFSKIYKEITFNYVDEINSTEFIKSGIEGMLKNLDPYTIYLDDNKKSDIDIMTNGKYGGIGVSIGILNNAVRITEVMEGYPGHKGGLKVGDIILEVDGFKVSVEKYDEVSPRVKGEPGTQLELKILRNNLKDTITLNFIREEILLKSLSFYSFFPKNSGIVYLKLNNFNKAAASEIQKAIKRLRSEREIQSVILDLRGNPGGLLESAIEVTDKFLPKNILIVSTKGRDLNSEKKYFANEEPILKNEKLVVLIDENSASASEILAGAIQDHDRGIILGTNSFGKGLVQTVTPITKDVSLKITTARYYTPTGRCIQKIDYSKENKVVKIKDDNKSSSDYFTDNYRKVFSSGGIQPDTIVENNFKNEFISELYAQGIIYEYLDFYIQNKTNEQFEIENDKNLYKDFYGFFIKKLDNLVLETNKTFLSFKKKLEKDSLDIVLNKELNLIEQKIKDFTFKLLEKNKNNIVGLLRIELTKRYHNTYKSLEESLKYDNQVLTALELLSNDKVYQKLLNRN